MKTPNASPNKIQSIQSFIGKTLVALLASSFLFASGPACAAAVVLKAPTGTNLNDPASWGGATPTPVDVATWDSTSLGAGLALPAVTNWQGISVSGALTDISVGGPNIFLTLGASGVDLSTSTVNAFFTNSFLMNASQTWNVGSGRTLQVGPIQSSALGVGLIKSGPGTLMVRASANDNAAVRFVSVGGDLNVADGLFVIGGNDVFVNGLTGTGTIRASETTRWLTVSNNVEKTFPGLLQDATTGIRLGLRKRDTGTLILTGSSNSLSDTITVENGTLRITGTLTNANGNNGLFNIGPIGNQNGFLDIAGGIVRAGKANNPSVQVGAGGNARGFIRLNNGVLITGSELHIGQGSGGAATTPFAAMTMNNSLMTNASWLVVGFNNDRAVLNQLSGDIYVTANRMTIGAGGANAIGIASLFGGTFNSINGTSGGILVGERGIGILNVLGTASVTAAFDGIVLGPIVNQTGWSGTLNARGGTITTTKISKGIGTGTAFANFHGATIKPSASNPTFMQGLDSAYVYSGGAIFDTSGFDITVGQSLLGPTGQGIVSIPVNTGGSGYIDTPLVLITNIDGVGATAIAQVDYSSGAITNILITNPGLGYFTPPIVALFGGGGTGATLGTPVLGATTSGGLTKNGAGNLTLSGGSSYTGATVVNGGTLTLQPNLNFYASTPLTVSNGTLSVDVGGGASISPNSVTLQNGATVAINYGGLSGNPVNPAVNSSGSLTAPGTGLTIAVNGIGLQPGQFTMVDYTGTPLANLANFSLATPPGVTATLSNNTANTSIDLIVTTAPQNLTWYGTNSDWDINTTFNFNSGAAKYLEYGTPPNVVGDAVRFDDTLFNDFVNPQSTNVNLTTTLSSFPVLVDSTLPYAFSGVGSLAGVSSLVKSNLGTLTIGTSNSYSGGTFIYGGSLIVSNSAGLANGPVTLGGGTVQVSGNTTNNRSITVTANSIIAVDTNQTLQLGGNISGAGALTKNDSGTLTITGTNVVTGTFTAAAGTVNLAGRMTNGIATLITVSGAGSPVFNIAGGVLLANKTTAPSLQAGSAGSDAGAIRMSSGTLTTANEIWLATASGRYGSLTIDGGTVNVGNWLALGRSGGNGVTAGAGVMNVNGGTVIVGVNNLTIGSLGIPDGGLHAVTTLAGGTFNLTNTAANQGAVYVGENINGILNVMGSAALNIAGARGVDIGVAANTATVTGVLNLLGGTIVTPVVRQNTPGNVGIVNFSGGTLRATATPASPFLSGLDFAYVYSGGAFIDGSNNTLVTIAQPLLAPTGFGVNSISLSTGGNGYIGAPIVEIIGGIGSGATAIAQINPATGVITNILVTSRGTGYDAGDSLVVILTGGGGTGATIGTVSLTANVSGGLTKTGTGTLLLTGANTYSGQTTVASGGLLVTPAHQGSGAVVNTNLATFGVYVNTNGVATVGNVSLGTSATGTNFLQFSLVTGTNPIAPVLQCGTLTLTGSNIVRLAGSLTPGTLPVLKYTGAIAGAGTFSSSVAAPQGFTATLSNDVANTTLYVAVAGGGGIEWRGTSTTPALTNLWGLNTVTNWVVGATPTSYQESAPPGDAVTFNDLGSGIVLVSNTVSPVTMTISNSAKSYTFSGSGSIGGAVTLVKRDTGLVTMGLANNGYSGGTILSNGTYQLGSATAIPDGVGSGNTFVNSGATLNLGGFSETINGLTGSGTINNSGGVATMTLGNGNGGVTWAGNMSGGNITLLKVGTGTVVFSGTNTLTGQSQINGGLTILTNNSELTSTEFWVAQNATTSTVVVANANLATANWLVVGRNNVAANGTLIVNSGTVQKSGPNNIVVGSLGATGTLIVNGGQVLNNGNLWLGENTGANATLRLNGGLIQATQVRIQGTTPASSFAYFNGGTLQASASSTAFIQSPVTGVMQSNGLVLDDNAFTISIPIPIADDIFSPGGAMVKRGTGIVYLDGFNTYTGTTVVTNGMLAGIGGVSGPLVVGPAGRLGAGDAAAVGIFSLNTQPVTLQGSARMRVDKTGNVLNNDLVLGITTVNYGGTLVVSNATSDATPLAQGDTFTLFSANTHNGNFTSIQGSPGTGLAYSFTNGILSVVTNNLASNPTNITFSVSGDTVTLSWPTTHLGWILQSQTNTLSVGLSSNWADITGSDAVTTTNLTVNPANPTMYFRLRRP